MTEDPSTIGRRRALGAAAAAMGLVVVDGTRPAGALPGGAMPRELSGIGDVELAMPDYAAIPGKVEGGVIRQATSLQIPWEYTQSVNPTDKAIGTAVNVVWDVVVDGPVDGNGDSFWPGPQLATGWFGPRATFNHEGKVVYAIDQHDYSIGPIGYGDLVIIENDPGQPRVLNHGWSFMSSRFVVANGAEVTLIENDTNSGGAAFVDTMIYGTRNEGSIDGVTNDTRYTSFLSAPAALGDVHLGGRYALHVKDWALPPGPVGEIEGLENPDDQNTVIDLQVGVQVDHLAAASRNIGISNGSTTVNVPQTSALPSEAAALRIDASLVVLNNTSGDVLTLTSVPTIPDGLDGQVMIVVNGSSDPVRLQGEADLTGSNVALTRTLAEKDAVTLTFTGGVWLEVAHAAAWIREQHLPGVGHASLTTPTQPGITSTHSTHPGGGATFIDIVGTPGETEHNMGVRLFEPGASLPHLAMHNGGILMTDGTGSGPVALTRAGPGIAGIVDMASTPQTVSVNRLRLNSLASLPAGPNVVGDMVTHNGVVKVCTTAGSPGTWTVVGSQT